MMIQLYVYKKIDGTFLYEDTGSLEGVISDIADNLDFTLKPYPSGTGYSYKWIDKDWVQYQPKGETTI